MSIREMFAERSKPQPRVCTTCEWFSGQPDDEQAAAREWVEAGFSVEELWRGLKKLGYPLGAISLRRHVRECLG